jgi:hypothetical protein
MPRWIYINVKVRITNILYSQACVIQLDEMGTGTVYKHIYIMMSYTDILKMWLRWKFDIFCLNDLKKCVCIYE